MKVWYKILILTIVMLFLFPVSALAHTHLTESNPADGAVVDTPLTEITLSFDTSIESLSTFELFDEDSEPITVDIVIDHDVMTGQLSQPLLDGSYVVQWDIIGVDGHPMKGNFSFEVTNQPLFNEEDIQEELNAEDEETANNIDDRASMAPATEDDAQDEEDRSNEPIDANTSEPSIGQTELAQSESDETQSEQRLLLISVIGLLLIVVIAIIWLFARRK